MPVLTNGFSSYNVLFADGPYGTTQKYTNAERRLNRLLRKGQGGRRLRAVLYALTGNAPGQQAVLTATRIKAVQALGTEDNQGGKVPIELVTLVNRPTTALDLLKMQDDMTHNNKPTPYPVAKGNTLGTQGMVNKIA